MSETFLVEIYSDLVDADGNKVLEDILDDWRAVHFHKCLRLLVCERTEPSALPCGGDDCLHGLVTPQGAGKTIAIHCMTRR
jgi:hypothetical protein